jgi:hypothetical protein
LRTASLCLVASLAASCVSAPPACHTSRHARVCASTEPIARETAERLDGHIDVLRELVPDLREGRVEVWLQEQPQVVWLFPAGDQVGAMTNHWSSRIHAREASPDLASELVHESVHALLGDGWDGLPATLEEGLADQLASRVVDDRSELRNDRLFRALAAVGGPGAKLRVDAPGGGWSAEQIHARFDLSEDFDLRDTYSRDGSQVRPYLAPDERAVWYGTAYVAAGRLLDTLGAAGLRELNIATRDLSESEAVDRLAAASGLGSDAREWRTVVTESYGPDERAALVRRHAAALIVRVVDIVQEQNREGTLRERIVAARPRLQVGPPDRFTLLMDVPEFAELVPDDAAP